MWTSHSIWIAAAGIAAINLPFGYWRAGVRKFSVPWFAAVHIPVPIAIGMRLLMHMPLRFVSLPIFVAAFFTGQAIGAKLRRPSS